MSEAIQAPSPSLSGRAAPIQSVAAGIRSATAMRARRVRTSTIESEGNADMREPAIDQFTVRPEERSRIQDVRIGPHGKKKKRHPHFSLGRAHFCELPP